MVALNSAMMADGMVIDVANGAVIPLPLQIVHVASGCSARGDVHALVDASRQGRRRTVVESYIAAEARRSIRSTTR